MSQLEGFGKRSVEKLLDAIEKSRKTTLDKFIYALSIPLIGRSASKDLAKFFDNDYEKFRKYGIVTHYQQIDGFGESMNNSLHQWLGTNHIMMDSLAREFMFEKREDNSSKVDLLSNMVFAITGSLHFFRNRSDIQNTIEKYGGKFSETINKRTTMLINNDINSKSSKNIKAKTMGIKIITEKEFINMIGVDFV